MTDACKCKLKINGNWRSRECTFSFKFSQIYIALEYSVAIQKQLNQNETSPFRVLLQLADVLWQQSIPLLVCRSYGMIGYMRLVVKEHTGIYTLYCISKFQMYYPIYQTFSLFHLTPRDNYISAFLNYWYITVQLLVH